jgi:hypothetical protein
VIKPVFPVRSLTRLSAILGLSKAWLSELADAAPDMYRHGQLLRPNKQPRGIRVPERDLALVQRRILDRLFVEFMPHECSYGGVKGRTPTAGLHSAGVKYIASVSDSRGRPATRVLHEPGTR